MEQSKLILVTNDDGAGAPGIRALAALMARLGEVVVVAPDAARSGSACAVSAAAPVGVREAGAWGKARVFTCTGTPADCVKLAVSHVCPRLPDLVASGINCGDNASVSALYSGTMGAALEACMKGVPAIGFSMCQGRDPGDTSACAGAVLDVARHAMRRGLPPGVCLNVNFPPVPRLAGVRLTRMARGEWRSEWADACNPRQGGWYWLTGEFRCLEPDAEDTDCWALAHGYASVTPVTTDMTAYRHMESLANLNS